MHIPPAIPHKIIVFQVVYKILPRVYIYIATSWVCRMLYICHVTAGKTIPPPRPSEPNPDYVQCPHCERRFEEYAAERHIPFCKEKHARIERKAQDKAMDKLNKRIQVYIVSV